MKHRSLALFAVLALLMALGAAIPAVAASVAGPGGFDVKFSGVIQTVGGAGGSWTIGGIPVQTNTSTQISLEGVTEAKAGMWADVMATKSDTGVFTALKVVVYKAPTKTPVIKDGEVSVYGPIEAFSAKEWTIAGVHFTITPATRIMGTPSLGLLAQGEGVQANGTLEAKLLKVTWVAPKRGATVTPGPKSNPGLGPAQFKGVIGSVPAGLIGTWVIGGRSIQVTARTIIQNGDEAKVGAKVHVVTAPPARNGETPTATLIQVLSDTNGPNPQLKAKPENKGKPEDKGKPEGAGKPAGKGKPEGTGKPAGKGNPGKGLGR